MVFSIFLWFSHGLTTTHHYNHYIITIGPGASRRRAQGDGLQPGRGALAEGLVERGRLLPGVDGYGLDQVRGRGRRREVVGTRWDDGKNRGRISLKGVHTCYYVYIYIYLCICIYTLSIYLLSVCLSVCLSIYMSICIYIYIYAHF